VWYYLCITRQQQPVTASQSSIMRTRWERKQLWALNVAQNSKRLHIKLGFSSRNFAVCMRNISCSVTSIVVRKRIDWLIAWSIDRASDRTRGGQKVLSPNILDNIFSQSIYQWNVHSLQIPISLMQIWRHCNLWCHSALKGNDPKQQRKRLASFIIVDKLADSTINQILDFKIENSHLGFGDYFLQYILGGQR